MVEQGIGRQSAARVQPRHGVRQGDEGAGNGCRAGTPVGLDDVAVQGDSALAEGLQVHCGAQRTADQALDLVGATSLAATGGFARGARARGPGQHAVLGGDPAPALVLEERRHPLVDAGRADDPGVAEAREHRALRVACEVAVEGDRPERIGGPGFRVGAWLKTRWEERARMVPKSSCGRCPPDGSSEPYQAPEDLADVELELLAALYGLQQLVPGAHAEHAESSTDMGSVV